MSRLPWILGVLLFGVDAGRVTSSFQYQRAVETHGAGASCAVLDPTIFEHAAESLRDLRIFGLDGTEVPYLITVSGTANDESVTIPVRNVIAHGGVLAFDLDMPRRPYSEVVLDLAATDFIATAVVTGREGASAAVKQLGQFAVFDLSAQHLSRSTSLHLGEAMLPTLHVELRAAPGSVRLRPEMVRGATVPPSREAQTLYSQAVRTTATEQRGHETVVHMEVPPRVPVERVRLELPASFHGDFNRAVRIEAHAAPAPGQHTSTEDGETIMGVIARLHLKRDGVLLTTDQMTIPATIGANLQAPASVTLSIENGIGQPLPISAVDLQTRERRLCFVSREDSGPLTLFYGDPTLPPPSWHWANTLLSSAELQATLGPEERNPAFAGRVDRRSLTRRHPRLLSLGLLLVVSLLGVLVLRSTKLRL